MPDTATLLRLLAEQTREHAIIILDTESRIQWWNGGAERIFGITTEEAIGQPLSRLFPADQVAIGAPELEIAVARTDSPAEDDRWLVRKDGSTFWAIGVLTALRDERGELVGFGKVLRNRTDLREQVETLRNQVGALELSHRHKDEFLSMLSHELRNPLAPLTNAVYLIRRTVPATPDLEGSLRVIERQVASLQRLVDDLLDLSRIGAGKVALKKERLAIQDVLRRAVDSTSALVRQRRHRLDLLAPSVPMFVSGDPDRLEQVFVNLINNAAKYTPEGGRIWVKATTEGDEAVVHIEDTGVGIPHDLLPRIFELFTQVESSRRHSQGGLGIGLSLVKNLVTLHGGSVQVRSDNPGEGSDFVVRLPLLG
jgi:PAS domain S-box-containing protein